MKIYVVLFFLFSNVFVFSQNEKLDRIGLEYSHSIKRNSKIEISIYPSYNTQNGYILRSEIKKVISEKEISSTEFKKIEKEIMKIKAKDFFRDFRFILDAPKVTISFSDSSNDVSYSVNALSKYDKNTSYKNFLKVTQKILKLADIKIDEIN
ncbi:hypothetical protein [Flavobacterium sp.]|uniref:hypothetical protein n=1 Tax=Flavobacterium sp. TaxID=239 RepID=UPI002632EBCE|nr:hypothetical protein [Flavobacterium sp.]